MQSGKDPERRDIAVAKNGLLIEYKYCTGCHSCEVACKQEHNLPAGNWGIKVNEILMELPGGRVSVYYIPVVTELCNLCLKRTNEGGIPSCVKHCQAGCMSYGPVSKLAEVMEEKDQTILLSPR